MQRNIRTSLAFHGAFFFPSIENVFDNTVSFLEKTFNYGTHFAGPIILLHDGLMLVDDKSYALKESRQRRYVV